MCPSHTRVSGLAHPTAAHPPPVGLSPARVVFAAADTQVPRLLPLPCCRVSALNHPPNLDRCLLCCTSGRPPARDNFRLIHGRCSTHSSCGSCTSAPSTTPTVAHAPLVGALWEQGGLTRDCLWEQHVTHTANVHPPPLSLSSLSQKLPSIRQFIGRYLKIKVMRRIATQITPNACHDLAPSGGIAAGQRPFRVRPHADLSNCGSYSQIPARGVRRWQRPAPTSSGVLSNICVAVCLSSSIFGYETYK